MNITTGAAARVPIRLVDYNGDGVVGILPASISNGTSSTVLFTKSDGSAVDLLLVNNVNWFEINATSAPGLYHILVPDSLTDVEGPYELTVKPLNALVFVTTHNTGVVASVESVTPYANTSELGIDNRVKFAESFAFPFRFLPDGDVVRSHNEKSIEDNIRSSVLIQKYGVPLRSRLGSMVPTMPFDPKDTALREQIIDEVLSAVAIGEPRALVDDSARFVDDPSSSSVELVMPYRVKATSKNWKNVRLTEKDIATVG